MGWSATVAVAIGATASLVATVQSCVPGSGANVTVCCCTGASANGGDARPEARAVADTAIGPAALTPASSFVSVASDVRCGDAAAPIDTAVAVPPFMYVSGATAAAAAAAETLTVVGGE